MAMSNYAWFTLFTEEPQEPEYDYSADFGGRTALVAGNITVAIYKNWLYVYHPEAWFDGNTYKEPVVSKIKHGDVEYGPVRITAERGPQKGIYTLVETGYRHTDTYRAMVGVGVFEEDKNSWDALTAESREYLSSFIDENNFTMEDFETTGCVLEGHPDIEDIRHRMPKPRVR